MSLQVLAKNKVEFLQNFSTNILPEEPNTNPTFSIKEMVFFLITAMLAGAENYVAISNFGIKNSSILIQYLPYKSGFPNINSIIKFLTLIESKKFDNFLRNVLENLIILIKNYSNKKLF